MYICSFPETIFLNISVMPSTSRDGLNIKNSKLTTIIMFLPLHRPVATSIRHNIDSIRTVAPSSTFTVFCLYADATVIKYLIITLLSAVTAPFYSTVKRVLDWGWVYLGGGGIPTPRYRDVLAPRAGWFGMFVQFLLRGRAVGALS